MFLGPLAAKIKSEIYIGWEADENHNRGGYEVCYADDETHALIRCANDLQHPRPTPAGRLPERAERAWLNHKLHFEAAIELCSTTEPATAAGPRR